MYREKSLSKFLKYIFKSDTMIYYMKKLFLKDAMHVTIVVSDILPAADAMAMKELPALRAMVQVWRWVYL
jgi:hypothetical protein